MREETDGTAPPGSPQVMDETGAPWGASVAAMVVEDHGAPVLAAPEGQQQVAIEPGPPFMSTSGWPRPTTSTNRDTSRSGMVVTDHSPVHDPVEAPVGRPGRDERQVPIGTLDRPSGTLHPTAGGQAQAGTLPVGVSNTGLPALPGWVGPPDGEGGRRSSNTRRQQW